MKIKFLPQNVEYEIEPHQSVMDLAHSKGIFIKTVCNGVASCAECRVRVIEGEHHVLPPSEKEKELIGTGYFLDQRRLSCQLKCFDDVVIDLSEQVVKEETQNLVRRKKAGVKSEEVSQAVTGNLILDPDGNKKDKTKK